MLHLCEGPVLGHIINTLRVFPLYITEKIESGNKAQHRIGFKPVTSRSYGMYSTTVAPKHLLNSTGTYFQNIFKTDASRQGSPEHLPPVESRSREIQLRPNHRDQRKCILIQRKVTTEPVEFLTNRLDKAF